MGRSLKVLTALVAVALSSTGLAQGGAGAGGVNANPMMPAFRLDAGWLKPLPRGASLGPVSGLDVDARQHVWVLQQGSDLPPVLEFDAAGNLVGQWGAATGVDWPVSPGPLRVDANNDLWIVSERAVTEASPSGAREARVLKFSRAGVLQLQVGKAADPGGSDSRTRLTHPIALAVDAGTNELYILDGGTSQRVVVFNATTGGFAREWRVSPVVSSRMAVLANRGLARPLPPFNELSAIALGNDGRVYVGDRQTGCVYLFKKDGTVESHAYFAKDGAPARYPWDFAFSRDPQQRFLYVADGRNDQLLIIDHSTLRLDILGTIGADGQISAGSVSRVAVDSKDNVYAVAGQALRRWVRELPGRRP